MPRFRVEALEKFVVRTIYHVEAVDESDAERLCKSGNIAYDEKSVEEGNEEWLETGQAQVRKSKVTHFFVA